MSMCIGGSWVWPLAKKDSARALAAAVLPTPVGPAKSRVAMGVAGSLMPAVKAWITLASCSSLGFESVEMELRSL